MARSYRTPDFWSKIVRYRVGRLVAESRNGTTAGTATLMVAGDTLGVISTAAHCLQTDGHQHTSARLSLALDKHGGVRRSLTRGSTFEVLRTFVPEQWTRTASVEHDYAFALVRIPPDFHREHLDTRIRPSFGVHERDHPAAIAGFEVSFVPRRAVLREAVRIDQPFMDATAYRAPCDVRSGGSGGPWMSRQNNDVVQFSVTSFGSRRDKKVLFGPVWGEEAESLYDSAAHLVSVADDWL